MKIVLLITVVESALIAVLMIWWRFRNVKTPVRIPLRATVSDVSAKPEDTGAVIRNAHWGFINQWTVAPQAQDRMQARGAVGVSSETASGRRSTARRKHQAMYKQWSRERHD